jgi:hypothetical protein
LSNSTYDNFLGIVSGVFSGITTAFGSSKMGMEQPVLQIEREKREIENNTEVWKINT